MNSIRQILLLILLSVVACRPSGLKPSDISDMEDLPPFDPATQQTFARLNIEHVEHFLESNPNAIILDVRARDDYDKAHLPRAISFPYDFEKKSIKEEMERHPDYGAKSIYFMYGSKEEFYAIDVAVRFRNLGFQNLFCMNGGIEDWIEKGLPVMSTTAVK